MNLIIVEVKILLLNGENKLIMFLDSVSLLNLILLFVIF